MIAFPNLLRPYHKIFIIHAGKMKYLKKRMNQYKMEMDNKISEILNFEKIQLSL